MTAAVAAERAQCCRDVCGHCRLNDQPHRGSRLGEWHHQTVISVEGRDVRQLTHYCPASAIWERHMADGRPPQPPAVEGRIARMKRFLGIAAALAVAVSLSAPATAQDVTKIGPGGSTSPDGKAKVIADLPVELRMHNTGGIGRGGPGTGAGLCVFTSIEHAGRYQNEAAIIGLQKYMTTRQGGGYPEKVDAVLKAYAPGVPYVQHTGGDEAFLRLALKTGRMVAVTYDGRDDFYGPRNTIAHMVDLIELDDSHAAILDNNREKVYVWMSRDEFLSRWRGTGGGWAVVLLKVPPPPPFPGNQ